MRVSDLNFDYLLPPKDVFNIKHTDHYIRHGKGKGSVRTIFANVEYDEDELEKLKEWKALIEKEKIVLPADWTEVDTKRYMYTGKLDLKKSMKVLKQHLEWRAEPGRGTIGPKSLKMIEDGIVYISGRDKQYRPIIIINVHKVDAKHTELKDFTDAICFVLDVARKYYFIPGKVENWVIFIEIDNTGLFSIPTKFVKSIIDVTAANYTSCLDKLYILNPTSFLKRMWSFISGFIDPETGEKINMLKKSDFKKLLERIAPEQLHQLYDGTLHTQSTYWPPINTLNQPPYNAVESPKTPEVADAGETLPTRPIQEASISFNPDLSDTRNLSVRQSTDEIKKFQTKQSTSPLAQIETIDSEDKSSENKIVDPKKEMFEQHKHRPSTDFVPFRKETRTPTSTFAKSREHQPHSEQNDSPSEQPLHGGISIDQKREEEVLKTEKQEYGLLEEKEHLIESEHEKRSNKDTHVTFGGVDVNEASKLYSARFGNGGGSNENHQEGAVLEREMPQGAFCGCCTTTDNKGQKRAAESGCNIF